MTGFTDARVPSGIRGAIQVAADIKEDQSGFLSGVSAFGAIATVLAIVLGVALIMELAWRERRQRRREAATASALEPAPREGDISP